MNTAHTIYSTGTINVGAYVLTFSTGCDDTWNWIELYDATVDDSFTKYYNNMDDVMNTLPLLMTSSIMREEFCK
jgi:hypothetical protein